MAAQFPPLNISPNYKKSYEGETRYLEIFEEIISQPGRGFM